MYRNECTEFVVHRSTGRIQRRGVYRRDGIGGHRRVYSMPFRIMGAEAPVSVPMILLVRLGDRGGLHRAGLRCRDVCELAVFD
jgi:hypothetical protein